MAGIIRAIVPDRRGAAAPNSQCASVGEYQSGHPGAGFSIQTLRNASTSNAKVTLNRSSGVRYDFRVHP
jgi:hypothetical protein